MAVTDFACDIMSLKCDGSDSSEIYVVHRIFNAAATMQSHRVVWTMYKQAISPIIIYQRLIISLQVKINRSLIKVFSISELLIRALAIWRLFHKG